MSKFNSDELLLLMVNLIQFKDKDRILKVFTNAVNHLDPDITLEFSKKLSDKYKFIIPISTLKSNFGVFSISGNYDNEFLEMMQNAVAMLALILEKLEQDEMLEKTTEDKYKSVIQDLPVLICRNKPDGTIDFVNDPYCEYFGKKREELIGRDIYQHIPKEDREMVRSNLASLNAENPIIVHEHKVINAKGEIKYHRWTNRAICDTKGKVINLQAYGEDITRQKEAEDLIKQEKEFSDSLLDAAQETIFLFDPETGKPLRWNSIFTKISGYTDKQIAKMKAPDDFYEPEALEKAYDALSQLEKTGKAITSIPLKTKKGKYIPFEYSVTNLKDIDGKTLVLSIGRDLRERHQAEKDLMESKRRLTTLITSISGMVYSCKNDKNWTMVEVSPGSFDVTGYTSEELTSGKINYADLIHPEDTQRIWEEVQKSIQNNTYFEFDYRIKTKDGNEKWVYERGTNINDERTKDLWLEGFITDITEQKKLEEERRQGEKLQAIGQLAGGVAHDLNNNLTAVMGFTSLLEMEINDPELKDQLHTIQKAAKRSAELTGQLLAFARKGKYENRPVDIHSIVFDVVSLLKRSISKKIKLKSEMNAVPSTTLGDYGQISNAVLNIALNARDAMESNEGILSFSTELADMKTINAIKKEYNLQKSSYIKINISDTGKGMTEDLLKRIFEPFFTTKEKGKGTGLGLSAAYGTVLNHEGAITVKSKEGKGTLFTIYLPLYNEKEERKKSKSQLEKGEGNIMVIDDEEYILTLVKNMLSKLGYESHPFKDAKKAISFYKKSWEKIDLIILDMVMPQQDGEEIFFKFREINPDAKILISSGYSKTDSINHLKEMGAIGSLPKPYKLENFSKAVKKAVEQENKTSKKA